MLSADEIKALPLLAAPVTVRVMFTKTGSLRYISHLDLQRTLTRCLIRSRLPVWYTKGFNPHTKLVFSLPLSVGCESVYEFVDIKIERQISLADIKACLAPQFTDEMLILDVYYPTSKFAEIAYAEYECRIASSAASAEVARDICEYLSTSPVTVMKRSKSGEKEIDIVPLIHSVTCEAEEGELVLKMVLSASSDANLNPEYPIKAVCERFSLLRDESNDYYGIMRKKIYRGDMSAFN